MLKLIPRCAIVWAICVACVCGTTATLGDPPDTKEQAKPKPELLVDEGKNLFILSDRPEKATEFFQRNRVVVGAIWQKDLNKLSQAKEPIGKLFLDYTSANDDPAKADRYGDALTLAPLGQEVAALIDKHAEPKGNDGDRIVTVILRRDAKAELYHVVGLTTHTPVSFFTLKEKLKGDDFAGGFDVQEEVAAARNRSRFRKKATEPNLSINSRRHFNRQIRRKTGATFVPRAQENQLSLRFLAVSPVAPFRRLLELLQRNDQQRL